MVLPWLIVGASAAFEMRRRNEPDRKLKEREKKQALRRLQSVEKELKIQKSAFDEKFTATLNDLKDSQATHAQDREKLAELEDLKVQYEERLMELSDITEGLKEENDALREDARHWKERSDAYFDENVELHGIAENLRIENGGLKAELEKVTQNNAAAMTEMKEMIQEIRDAVTTSLQAFTDGTTSVAELQESLRDAGVAVSLKPEELERLRTSPEAAKALEDVVCEEFNSQVSLVLEDRSRLEHFMGIAQSLRLGRGEASSQGVLSTAGAAVPALTHHGSDAPSMPATLQTSVGAGILDVLTWGSRGAASPSKGDRVKQPLASITGVSENVKASGSEQAAVAAVPAIAGKSGKPGSNGVKAKQQPWFGGKGLKVKQISNKAKTSSSKALAMANENDDAFAGPSSKDLANV